MTTIQNDTRVYQLLTTILEKEEEEEPYEDQYTIDVIPLPLPFPIPYSNVLWNLCLVIQSGICMYIVLFGFIGGIIYLCVDIYKTS